MAAEADAHRRRRLRCRLTSHLRRIVQSNIRPLKISRTATPSSVAGTAPIPPFLILTIITTTAASPEAAAIAALVMAVMAVIAIMAVSVAVAVERRRRDATCHPAPRSHGIITITVRGLVL